MRLSVSRSQQLAPLLSSSRQQRHRIVLAQASSTSSEVKTRTSKVPPKIKVVGVGGGAFSSMFASHLTGVELYMMDTDAQELSRSLLPESRKVLLGAATGEVHSMHASVGTVKAVIEAVQGADLVIVVAGMGAAGARAAPLVAEFAKQQGATVVAMAAMPRTLPARQAFTPVVHALEEIADGLVVVPTHKLSAGSDTVMSNAEVYDMSSRLLLAGIQGMVDWVAAPGTFSDVDDIRDFMSGGITWIGHAAAIGPERAACVATAAINSPMRLEKASSCSMMMVVLSIPSGVPLKMGEFTELIDALGVHCGEKTHMEVCATENPTAISAVSLTLFATHPRPSTAQRTLQTAGIQQQIW